MAGRAVERRAKAGLGRAWQGEVSNDNRIRVQRGKAGLGRVRPGEAWRGKAGRGEVLTNERTSMMETIRFRITGTYPLLQHNPMGSMKAGGGPATMGRKVIPTPEEEADLAAYKLDDGTYYQRTTAIRSALIDAGVGRRIGKMGAAKVLSGAVFTTAPETGLYHPATLDPITGHKVDLQRVVVQKNGVLRGRARIDHWMCEVEFEYDELEVTPAILLELLNIAGRRVGIGDYRPRCPNGKGGPYGRFTAEIV